MESDIKDFALEAGYSLRKPSLSDTLTEDQLEQIKYAREQGVTWVAIARFFKDRHNIDYSTDSYRRLFE